MMPLSTQKPSHTFANPSSRPVAIAWALFAVLVVGIIIVQGRRFLTRDMIDFSVVYRVGQRLLNHQPIYDFNDAIMLFKYAPIIGYGLIPLAWLSKIQSAFVFFVLSVGSFAGCFCLSYRMIRPAQTKGWIPLFIIAGTFLSTLRVIMNSLDFGQVQVFILLGMLFSAGAFAKKQWFRGGFVLSLLALSKIVPAILCLPWLARRQWKPALMTAGIGAILLIVPALWLGFPQMIDLTSQWASTLRASTNQNMIERWTNQSLLAALTRIFAYNHYHVNWFDWDLQQVVLLTNTLLAGWLTAIVGLGLRRDSKYFPSPQFAQALDLSHYLLLIILAFPLAWRYHFTSMILPNMLILTHLLCYDRHDRWTWGLFISAFFLSSVINQEIFGSRLFEWFYLRSCLTGSVLCTLAALIRIDLRYRRPATPKHT